MFDLSVQSRVDSRFTSRTLTDVDENHEDDKMGSEWRPGMFQTAKLCVGVCAFN